MPWNYPIWQLLRFAVPALMAGNTCLVKPAPSVPQCTQLLLELVQAAGLDCLDIAWIDHELVEEAIRRSDAVAFTGSTHTGRIIASLAGKHLKKTVLELGGSNPSSCWPMPMSRLQHRMPSTRASAMRAKAAMRPSA
jgi:succinate-semialdehyde dehydrogenase/glutarate-semialdehyde dehydrogenase/succinate-semialdehyde dehydrogenase